MGNINYDNNEMIEKQSMKDMIHKCLRCGSISYEAKPEFYHCPECGFEWEVV